MTKLKITPDIKKRINKIFIITFWVLFATPFITLGTLLMLVSSGYYGKLPTFEELESPKSNIASDLIADDGTLLGQYYVQNRTFVDYSELSPHLIDALIATEDARYTSHSGIDFISLFRVAFKTVLMGDNQGGGSTITQQLAKNLFPRNIASNDGEFKKLFKTVIAKLKEWITAARLEYNYTKEEILVMYFNIVEFGNNSFGIKSAAQTYFNKLPSELNVEESAMLVGVVNAITRYNPIRNYDNSLARRNTVISRMHSAGSISKSVCDSLKQLPITLNFKVSNHTTGQATYFRSMVRQYMNAPKPTRNNFASRWDYEQELKLWESDPLYGWCHKNKKSDGTSYNIYRDGLKIHTTINPKMQQYAEKALVTHLRDVVQPAFDQEILINNTIFSGVTPEEQEAIMWSAIRQTERYRSIPKNKRDKEDVMSHFRRAVPMKVFSYNNPNGIDTLLSPYDSIMYHKSILRGSFMAITPQSGEVKAYVGGNDFQYFQYDMVKQGRRQVGSTIKPFIYTFGIDHLGFNECTEVVDQAVTVDGWQPGDEGVTNYSGLTRPLWWGLAKSRNNFSAWIIQQSNYTAVADMINKMGIRSYIAPVPSMCLGPSDITLYEMVGAYATFANKGVYSRPIFVTKIEDRRGEVLSRFSTESNEVISEKSASTILSILQKVVTEGTARRLGWGYELRNEIAGKTGTTNNGSDGWFIGITPKLTAGGWVGGENRSIHPERDSEGSRMALPIYAEFMKMVYADSSLNIKRTDKFIHPLDYTPIECESVITEKQENVKNEKKSSSREMDFFY